MQSSNDDFAKQLETGSEPKMSNSPMGPPMDATGQPPGEADRLPVKTYQDDRWIDDATFAAANDAYPDVTSELKARFRETKSLKTERDELRAQLAEAHQHILTSKGPEAPAEKTGWAAFTNAQLRDYDTKADQLYQSLASDPDNEDLRKEVTQINPSHRQAVREELWKRQTDAMLDEFSKKNEAVTQEAAYSQRAASILVNEYGAEALRDTGDNALLTSAQEIAREALMGVTGTTKVSAETLAVAELLAVRLANQRQVAQESRGPEVRDARILRGLDIAGQTGRQSSAASARSSALARGDVESVYQNDLDSFLDATMTAS